MGTSSNAPKETKCVDGKDDQRSLGKPVIWAGMFLTNKLNPVNMITCIRDECNTRIEIGYRRSTKQCARCLRIHGRY